MTARSPAVIRDACGADAGESAPLTARSPAVILFDLDGTLSDSGAGILAALRPALAEHGVPELDPVTERALLGPPFYTSLIPYVGEARVPAVIAAYRRRYVEGGGMFDTRSFDGTPQLLRALVADGRRLALATSKMESSAVSILEHLGVADCFDVIGGDTPDGSLGTKSLVIGAVLERLGHPDQAAVLMVGDREHDVYGARDHGIGTLGVAWGYAAPGELEGAGALAVCATPDELGEHLGLAS